MKPLPTKSRDLQASLLALVREGIIIDADMTPRGTPELGKQFTLIFDTTRKEQLEAVSRALTKTFRPVGVDPMGNDNQNVNYIGNNAVNFYSPGNGEQLEILLIALDSEFATQAEQDPSSGILRYRDRLGVGGAAHFAALFKHPATVNEVKGAILAIIKVAEEYLPRFEDNKTQALLLPHIQTLEKAFSELQPRRSSISEDYAELINNTRQILYYAKAMYRGQDHVLGVPRA